MSSPIKVLQVVTHMNRGGLETMLMNYYRHIDREKIQFDFLVHREERADYDDEIESLGGNIYRLPRLVPWQKSYLNALHDFFSEHPEYKIVHVHQDCLSSVILKAAKEHNIPVRIAHSHSSSQDKNLKYFVKIYYKRMIPHYATHLFACGKQAGDWMFGGEAYQVLKNAIDSEKYIFSSSKSIEMRSELNIPNGYYVIGHVGRFSYPKNHDYLIDIFKEIHRVSSKTILLLVGDGNLRTDIEKKIELLNLKNSVIFTGVRSDIPELLQAMDAFVFPSRYEGLPVTMIEAQASGLPCFISDRVPEECKITDLVKTIPLTDSPDVWAKEILLAEKYVRRNTREEIILSGFDIVENSKWLQNFYIEQWKAN